VFEACTCNKKLFDPSSDVKVWQELTSECELILSALIRVISYLSFCVVGGTVFNLIVS